MLRAADTTQKTDTGRQRRGNEDSSLAHPPVFVVADGMGGAQAGEVDTWTYPVRADDVLLLCSDGLTSMITEERIAEILSSSDGLDRKADELIAEANKAGGRDNITVVLFRLEDVGSGGLIDAPTI